jgi:hypothetical protein
MMMTIESQLGIIRGLQNNSVAIFIKEQFQFVLYRSYIVTQFL